MTMRATRRRFASITGNRDIFRIPDDFHSQNIWTHGKKERKSGERRRERYPYHRWFFYSRWNDLYQTHDSGGTMTNESVYFMRHNTSARICVQKKMPINARSKRCVENPRERSMLRRVCSARIFIRPIAMPSPNNARPSFVRAVPSAREIQPRPQLWISPG